MPKLEPTLTPHLAAFRIRYPTDNVIGLVATQAQVQPVLRELAAGGVALNQVRVTIGAAAADHLRASGGRGGLLGWLSRVAERLGIRDDKMATKPPYEQSLRDGYRVVAVGVPDGASREQVSKVLRAHGGRFINCYGRFAIYRLTY